MVQTRTFSYEPNPESHLLKYERRFPHYPLQEQSMSPRLSRAALALALCFAALPSFAQRESPSSTDVIARFTGALESQRTAQIQSAGRNQPDQLKPRPDAIGATPAANVIVFNSAAVGIAPGSAQQLTATFAVSGYSGSFTPTAALHYGHDYSLGAVSCIASGDGENCSVPVTFAPTLPGGRKDAIFLNDGATRLATVLLYGIGQAPLAAVQPGVVTQPASIAGLSTYIYNSTVDENGTVYRGQRRQHQPRSHAF
jgi:hypothetical protein